MLQWFEKARQKSEGTRFIIVNVLFIILAGSIFSLWIWSLTGSLPYSDVIAVKDSTEASASEFEKKFKEFQLKLGEIRENFFQTFQAYKTENFDTLQEELK